MGIGFSPDGAILASTGYTIAANVLDGEVTLWDVRRRTRLASLPDAPSNPVFSPDGATVATVDSRDGTVRIWDRAAGKYTDQYLACIESRPLAQTFSADGHVLATSCRDRPMMLRDVPGRQPLANIGDRLDDPLLMRFSPAGRTLATVNIATKWIQLWNIEAG